MRNGDWMQTYSGHQFWPLDPCAHEVHIEDIAHSLANQCRFAGHCERFYSVAEHSVWASLIVHPSHALMALLHDATEAYCVDVPRPLKRNMPEYMAIEDRIWLAIAERFGLPEKLPPEIKRADNEMLLAEQGQIMKRPPVAWRDDGVKAADVRLHCLAPVNAEGWFLSRYRQLTLANPLKTK